MKVCGKCRQAKPIACFHVRKASKDGLAHKCAECVKLACAEWRAKNPGAFKGWYAANREQRAEYWKEWYEANKEHRSHSYAEWAKNNPHTINALIAKRRASKRRQTPSWANHAAIRAIYAEAARLTKETGIRHEVDHIYPLQGDLVCGLHVETNLQILTKIENIRKHNRMPEEFEAV